MTALTGLAETALTRLRTVITTYDGPPTGPAPARYAVLFDGIGTGLVERHAATYTRRRVTLRVMGVARTVQGIRDTLDDITAALTGWIPAPDVEQLREVSTGPVLEDGPESDRRLSVTVEYATHTTRRTP